SMPTRWRKTPSGIPGPLCPVNRPPPCGGAAVRRTIQRRRTPGRRRVLEDSPPCAAHWDRVFASGAACRGRGQLSSLIDRQPSLIVIFEILSPSRAKSNREGPLAWVDRQSPVTVIVPSVVRERTGVNLGADPMNASRLH